MPAPIVAAPFLLVRVGMFLIAGVVSIGLAVLRNSDKDEPKDPPEKK